jgi:hypothetical protein
MHDTICFVLKMPPKTLRATICSRFFGFSICLISLFFISSNALLALDLERIGYLSWERGYGGDGSEEFRSVAIHPDGGYVFAGSSTSSISGDKRSQSHDIEIFEDQRGDYWWVHVDASGEVLNDRSYGGFQRDTLSFMLSLDNGDFLLVGSSLSPPSGNKTSPRYGSQSFSDAWVLRIDKHGDKLWERSFGGVGLEGLSGGLEMSNGRLLLAGTTSSAAGTGNRTAPLLAGPDGWLLCLSAQGDFLWEKTYGGEAVDQLRDISYSANTAGQILLAGYSSSQAFVTGDDSTRYHEENFWILAVDELGEIEWQRFYGGFEGDYATSILSTPETTLVGGYSDSGIGGSKTTIYYGDDGWTYHGLDYFTEGSRHHGWVIRLDGNGEKIQEWIYGGIRQDEIHAMLPFGEGWLIGADSNSYPLSDPSKGNKSSPQYASGSVNNLDDFWLIATNSSGGIEWELSLGGYASEYIHDLVAMPEGIFTVGSSRSLPGGGNRFSKRMGTGDGWIAIVDERTAVVGAVQVWVNGIMRDDAGCTVPGSAQLELISSNSSLDLHYTLDGSDPTVASPVYSSELVFENDVTVKARAFDHNGNTVGPTASVPVTVLSRYPLVVDSTLGGDVSVSPESTDSNYVVGADVDLEAVSDPAWQFDRWTGDASGSNPAITLEMDGPKTITANFYSLAITLELNGSGVVTKSPDKSFYELGESVTLEAIPAEGHMFLNWNDGVTNPIRTIIIGKDNSYAATFIDSSSDEYEPFYYSGDEWLYGSNHSYETLYSIGSTGSGYLIASEIGSGLWMLRLNAEGELEDQFMSGMFNENRGRFTSTQDGGLLFPGHGGNANYPEFDVAQFAKYDAQGNEAWVRYYKADMPAPTKAVIETSDGGYAILTRTKAGIGGDKTVPRPTTEGYANNYDVWLLRTDVDGNILWQQSYGGNFADDPHFIIETTSGDFLLLVTTNSAAGTGNNTSGPGVWILKVDGNNGEILWQRSYGVRADLPQGMVLNADGGFTFAGSTTYPTDGKDLGSEWGRINSCVWVLRADATGQVIWSKGYGGANSDKAGDLMRLEGGGFMVAAQSNSSPSTTAPYNKTARSFGSNDYWLFALDPDGEIIWQDSYGGTSQDNPSCLIKGNNGEIIIGGDSNSPLSGTKSSEPHSSGFDFWFESVLVQSQKKGQPILFLNGNAWNGSELNGDREVRLELSLSVSSDPIYYTLDGSDPLTNCTLASGVIEVSEDAVLRAVVIPGNGDPPVEREPVTISINQLYALNVDVPGGGSVSIAPDKVFYEEGELVTLTAAPDNGWQFMGWVGDLQSNIAEFEFMMQQDVYLRADFGTEIRLEKAGGNGIIDIEPLRELYRFGERVTLAASGSSGDVFHHWSGNADGSTNPLDLEVREVNALGQNPTYIANFSENLPVFSLSVSATGPGTVSQNPETDQPSLNEKITFTPIPQEGAVFSHWEINGTASREETLSLSIDADTQVDAVFKDENLEWKWIYPNPISDRAFTDIVYGSARFVAVGADGMIRLSFNGYDWTLSQGVSPEIEIQSVIWDGTRFLAVGYKGSTREYFAVVSQDGDIWGLLPIGSNIQHLCYGNGVYVATTASNLIASMDLQNWTVVQSSGTAFGPLVFEGGRFVAASSDFYSSEDGTNWEMHSSGQSSPITSIRWIDGRYYATATRAVLTSLDALAWEVQTPNITGDFTDIVKAGGIFLLSVDSNTTKPLFSGPTLSNLQELTDFDLNTINAIAANDNAFIVVGAKGWIRLSHDGVNFVEPIKPQIEYGTFPGFNAVAIGPSGRVVAGGTVSSNNNSSGIIASWSDEETYSEITVGGYGIHGIVYGNGIYLALVDYNFDNKVTISTDGINWSELTQPGASGDKLVFVDDRFFTLSFEKLSHSVDGFTWNSGNFYNYDELVDMLEFKGALYLATEAKLLKNTSSTNYHEVSQWSEVTTFEYGNIIKLATDGNKLLAVSRFGSVGYSSDGVVWDWTDFTADDGRFDKRYLTDIIFDGQRFLLTGYFDPDRYGAPTNSLVYSSVDGLAWEEHIVSGEYTRAIDVSEGKVVRGLSGGVVVRGSAGLSGSRLVPSNVNYRRGVTIPGESLDVQASVLNIGSVDWAAEENFQIDFLLSRVRGIQSQDEILLGTIDGSNGIQAGAQETFSVDLAIPAGIGLGDYYLHTRFRHPEYTGSSIIAPGWVSENPDVRVRINRFEDWIQTQIVDASGEPIEGAGTVDKTNGVENLLIYAEGLSTADMESIRSGSVETVERDGQKYFCLSYTRRRDAVDLEWIPQVSQDLITWDDAVMTLEEEIIQESVITVKFLDTESLGSSDARFIRLKVQKLD